MHVTHTHPIITLKHAKSNRTREKTILSVLVPTATTLTCVHEGECASRTHSFFTHIHILQQYVRYLLAEAVCLFVVVHVISIHPKQTAVSDAHARTHLCVCSLGDVTARIKGSTGCMHTTRHTHSTRARARTHPLFEHDSQTTRRTATRHERTLRETYIIFVQRKLLVHFTSGVLI